MKIALRQFVICLLLILSVLLNACNMPFVASPTAETSPALREGLTMAWVDGGNLFSLVCDGRWMWASQTPVTNNMYSLCMQAGNCTPPSGPQETRDLIDPTKGNQPVKIVDSDKNFNPEQAADYCAWIQGRLPTDEETADIAALKDANGNPQYPSEEGTLRCIVDNPRPMALYCESSPYYDPTLPIEDMNHPIEPQGSFCQGGISYVTFDIALDSNDTLQSVIPQGEGEDCQVVDGNRMVCGGASGSSTTVIAGLVCDSMPGIMDSSFAGIMDSSIAGIMDSSWELDANGAPIPSNGVQFNDLGLRSDPFTPKFVFINGVMVAQSAGRNASGSNDSSRNGTSNNGLPNNGSSSNGNPSNGVGYPVCPPGYYFDDETQTCNSVAPPNDTTCIAGYNLDPSNSCCEVSTPDGNYPGCPVGQMFDPVTGLCDSQTTLVAPNTLLYSKSFDVTFPDCSSSPGGPGESGPGGGSPGESCPAGETYTCDPVCGCAPG